MRTPVPIAEGFYVDESLAIASRRCVNLYPHIPEGLTITDGGLYGVGGVEEIGDIEDDTLCRGGATLGDIPYVVYGEKLYRIDYDVVSGDFDHVDVSGEELIIGTERLFFADNGTQIVIVAPELDDQFNAWVYSVAGGLERISDVDFDGPVTDVRFSDGFFTFGKQDSNKWFISDLRDGTSYISTDFGAAEADPDSIIAHIAVQGKVYIFGTKTHEQFVPDGGVGFPYVRNNSGTYNKGCLAPHSLEEFSGMIVWIGGGENEQPGIWATNGGAPQKLSTPSIDNLINRAGRSVLRNAYTLVWSESGHFFAAFTVPTVGTVVYDQTTGKWHERESWDQFLLIQPWRVSVMLDAYDVTIVGDHISSKYGRYARDITSEYGNEIKAYFDLPAIDNGGKPFSVNQFELVVETGTVPISGPGSDPKVRFRISRDSGRTYAPPITRSLGRIGEYRKPISWPLLGRFPRAFCGRVEISTPIRRYFVKGELEIGS